ncbi:ester hydrolase c11orf54-like protein [Phlyctema vagabunda]|uniref:Ester hydrolase c11orf54-like protein n=1 Tax=Phlyctema vagabunda TaxID=108571 RepID=A0ABR4P809_9HELO
MSHWPIKKYDLEPPRLEELAPVIEKGLKQTFRHVTAEVTVCPDLRKPPFSLASEGISGNERIADIGGPPYLHPTPRFDRKYSLPGIMKLMEMPESEGFVLGAGAGPFHVVGVNSELMPNLEIADGKINNLTQFAKVDEEGKCFSAAVPGNSTEFALMANLFGSDGKTGDVLKISARERTGQLNFLAAIQEGLKAEYGERPVSIGGAFVIRKGKASLHVMPDFSTTPLETSQGREWLRFYEMTAPLVCLTVFHSHDPGLDLRMEHTHCFSDHGEGGHYHCDTTPEEVEYEAYLNTAKVIYRIDQPEDK